MEVRRPVVAGDHGLAVDQERRGFEPEGSVDDGREAIGPVMAAAREAADARAIPAHHQAVAIVLDFVNPHWAGRRPGHPRGLARFDEAGGWRPFRPPRPMRSGKVLGFPIRSYAMEGTGLF
jgi:hypothetical protein